MTWIHSLVGLPIAAVLLLKLTILLAVAWTVHHCLRGANPRWRVLLWRGALAGLFLLPFSARLTPIPVGIEPPPHPATEFSMPMMALAQQPTWSLMSVAAESAFSSPENQVLLDPPPAPNPSWTFVVWLAASWPWLLLGCWMLGVGLGCLRLLAAIFHLRTVLRAARPVPQRLETLARRIAAKLGYTAPVRLFAAPALASPLLTGWFRPTMLLPDRMIGPKYEWAWAAILAHELSHLRSRDLPWMLALRWMSILLWPHPLVWRIPAVHAATCEEVSDAIAADYVGNPTAYTHTLARVALEASGRRNPLAALPMARSSEISRRIAALQRMLAASPLARQGVASALSVGAILLVLLGGLRLVEAQTASSVQGAVIAPESVPAGARLLHFPPDRSLGQLFIQDANPVRKVESVYYHIDGTGWETYEYLGEAQGDIVIPAGKRAILFISEKGARDLSPLDRLAPDALHRILTYAELTDAALTHIGRLGGLRELNLENMGSARPANTCAMTPQGIASLRGLTHLERLTMPNGATNGHLAAVAGLSSLKGLYFRLNVITSSGLAALDRLSGLEELCLNASLITDAGLAHLAQLSRLQYLMLLTQDPGARNFSDAGMAYLVNLPSLKILQLMHLPLGDQALAHIGKIAGLERLSLRDTQATDAGIGYLTGLRRLQELDLGQTRITAAGLARLKEMPSLETLVMPRDTATDALIEELTRLPRLTRLEMPIGFSARDKRFSYGDRSLELIAARHPEIEVLDFGGHGITDAGLARLTGLKHLKNLRIFGAPNVTNEGLASLANISTLEGLQLMSMNGISTRGVNHLNRLVNLRSLRVNRYPEDKFRDDILNLSALTKLESIMIVGLRDEDLAGFSNLTRMRRLQVGGTKTPRISDAGMAHLAGLTNLNTLSIGGNAITDRSLPIVAKMRKLDHLGLTGNFTDAGLRQLEGLTAVRTMNLRSTNKFSPEAVARFRASLPYGFGVTIDQERILPNRNSESVRTQKATEKAPEPTQAAAASKHPKPGAPAPAFAVQTLDDKPFWLANQRGKVVLVCFWATWCSPCVAALPDMNRLHAQLKEKFGDRVELIGLSMDDDETALHRMVGEKQLTWPQARIGLSSRIAADYGVTDAPDDFMIGPDGRILLNRESPENDTFGTIVRALETAQPATPSSAAE